jgi:hypothetical protein
MLRVIKPKDGEIFIDRTGKAAGRGAYICDDEACVKKCIKVKLFNKVFSAQIPESVYESIKDNAKKASKESEE